MATQEGTGRYRPVRHIHSPFVMPAKAGIPWTPAFAGMTGSEGCGETWCYSAGMKKRAPISALRTSQGGVSAISATLSTTWETASGST